VDCAGVDDVEELPCDVFVAAPPSPLAAPDPPPAGLLLEPDDALEVLDLESVE
jgi:hypothetical protein